MALRQSQHIDEQGLEIGDATGLVEPDCLLALAARCQHQRQRRGLPLRGLTQRLQPRQVLAQRGVAAVVARRAHVHQVGRARQG